MRVVMCLDRRDRPPYKNFYDALEALYREEGYEVIYSPLVAHNMDAQALAHNPDVIVIWNGYAGVYAAPVERLRRSGKKLVFHEIAWFPQNMTMYVDNGGIIGHALRADRILMNYDIGRWNQRRNSYLGLVYSQYTTSRQAVDCGVKAGPMQDMPEKGYVLIPGQLEEDTSMKFCQIRTMQALIDTVASHLPEERIIYRPHPVRREQALRLPPNVTKVTHTPLYPTLEGAKAVVGLNSTVLLEALLMRVPAFALGDGVWSAHPATVYKVTPPQMAAAVRLIENHQHDVLKEAFVRHLFEVQIRMDKPVFNERNRRVLLA